MTESSDPAEKAERSQRSLGFVFIVIGIALAIALRENGAWASGLVFVILGLTFLGNGVFRKKPAADEKPTDEKPPTD